MSWQPILEGSLEDRTLRTTTALFDGFPGSFMLGLSDFSVVFPRGDDPGRITDSPSPEVSAGTHAEPHGGRGEPALPAGEDRYCRDSLHLFS